MEKRDLVMEDITELYRVHAQGAVNYINTTGKELMPQLAAVVMSDEPGKVRDVMVVDPRLVSALHCDDGAKDVLMKLVRLILQHGAPAGGKNIAPDAVVHIAEGWMVARQHTHDGQLNIRDLANGYLDGYASLDEHPDRVETLMVTVHTRHKSYGGICPITSTDAGRCATYVPLDPKGIMLGRLSMSDERSDVEH